MISGMGNTIENVVPIFSVEPIIKKDVRIVLLTPAQLNTQGRAILHSADTTSGLLALLPYNKDGFQIEFLLRDAKQYTGLRQ